MSSGRPTRPNAVDAAKRPLTCSSFRSIPPAKSVSTAGPRIVEIRDNLIARIAEAEREGWLGDLEALNISLAGANDKLARIDRRPPPPQSTSECPPPDPSQAPETKIFSSENAQARTPRRMTQTAAGTDGDLAPRQHQ
jgi:hypothetical protein